MPGKRLSLCFSQLEDSYIQTDSVWVDIPMNLLVITPA